VLCCGRQECSHVWCQYCLQIFSVYIAWLTRLEQFCCARDLARFSASQSQAGFAMKLNKLLWLLRQSSLAVETQYMYPAMTVQSLNRFNGWRRGSVVKPQFHLARHVTSQHDLTRSMLRASRDERIERIEPCCFNMADDEQAIVLVCTSLVVFMLLHTQILLVLSNKIN